MTTTSHRSLAERGGRKAFVRDKGLAHTQKGGKKYVGKNPIFTNLEQKIREHKASSKANSIFLTK